MSRRRGLGSGLDALIPGASTSVTQSVRQIKIDLIRENRSQPRSTFDEQALQELASSIREHGIIQPIIVSEDGNGGFELIAGERRWRAAQRAGLSEVPALVKEATPQQLLELALVENVQRADLNALEEGLAYQELKDSFGLSDEQIAKRVGKSRVAVVNARRLIKLSQEARNALLEADISAGHGRALLRFDDSATQNTVLDLIRRRELSVRDVERLGEVVTNPMLADSVRQALLRETVTLAHAQELLRLGEKAQQAEALDLILTQGLSVRETERLCSLLIEGTPISKALSKLRERDQLLGQAAPSASGSPAPARPTEPARESRALSPEDAEAQRLFEEALETPVQLARSGKEIRLTITVFSDEQLDGLYELLSRK